MKAHSLASGLLGGLTATLFLSCATYHTKTDKEAFSYWGIPYSGIRAAIKQIRCGEPIVLLYTIGVLTSAIDFPFSLIADTFVLPVDLTHEPPHPTLQDLALQRVEARGRPLPPGVRYNGPPPPPPAPFSCQSDGPE